MEMFFKYLPLLQKLSKSQNEISQLQTLLAPTWAEFMKVKLKVLPLLNKIATDLQSSP